MIALVYKRTWSGIHERFVWLLRTTACKMKWPLVCVFVLVVADDLVQVLVLVLVTVRLPKFHLNNLSFRLALKKRIEQPIELTLFMLLCAKFANTLLYSKPTNSTLSDVYF